jgi:hypothetical protein
LTVLKTKKVQLMKQVASNTSCKKTKL